MKKFGLNILLTLVFVPYLFSQITTMTIGSVNVCPDEEVLIPIDVTDFNDIGAFTLFIGYDTTLLSFIELVNENPEAQGIFSNAMVSPTPQVGISWSSFIPANIASGKLFDLKFHYHADNCDLTFNDGCELVNSSLVIVEFLGTNGEVKPDYPDISQNPVSITIDEDEDANFNVTASDVSTCQWQISEDDGSTWNNLQNNSIYAGVNTNLLLLSQVPIQMNGNQYRCFLCHDDCCTLSEPAVLSVNFLSVSLNEDEQSNDILKVYPNPFVSKTNFIITMKSTGQLIITLYDLLGRKIPVLNEDRSAGEYKINFDGKKLKDGFYFCYCEIIYNSDKEFCIKRIIKNRD